jgi:hypothetical protein
LFASNRKSDLSVALTRRGGGWLLQESSVGSTMINLWVSISASLDIFLFDTGWLVQ